MGVPFLQVNEHRKEVHRDCSKEGSSIGHNIADVWVDAGKRQWNNCDEDIEHNKITLVHGLLPEEHVKELGSQEKVQDRVDGEELKEDCESNHEAHYLIVVEHVEAILSNLTLQLGSIFSEEVPAEIYTHKANVSKSTHDDKPEKDEQICHENVLPIVLRELGRPSDWETPRVQVICHHHNAQQRTNVCIEQYHCTDSIRFIFPICCFCKRCVSELVARILDLVNAIANYKQDCCRDENCA